MERIADPHVRASDASMSFWGIRYKASQYHCLTGSVGYRMVTLVERGDNNIEGHYAERTYAAVLMSSIPWPVQKQIMCLARGVRKCSYTPGFCGLLYGCSDTSGKVEQSFVEGSSGPYRPKRVSTHFI